MISIKKLKQKCVAKIEGEMTIYNAAELKEKLMPALLDERDLEINLANINEIDSAGLQLLMLAKKERTARDLTLSLIDHSESIIDVFELMDLVSYFKDPVLLANSKGEQHGS